MTTVPPTCSGAPRPRSAAWSTTPPASTRSTTSSSTSRAARCRRWPRASAATAAAPRFGAPLASALTDTQGRFTLTLEPVPSTTNVPLVMQVGKWRRQIMIPSLTTCANNALTDKDQTRLPRSQGGGQHPAHRRDDGRRRRARVPAAPDRHRRHASSPTTRGTGRVHLYAGGDGTNSFMARRRASPPRRRCGRNRDQARAVRRRRCCRAKAARASSST